MIIMLHPNTGLGVLSPTKAGPKLATDSLQAAAVSNKAPGSMDQSGLRGAADEMKAAQPGAPTAHLLPSGQGQAALTVTQENSKGDLGFHLPEHTDDAIAEPCGCRVKWVARGSQRCSNAYCRAHSCNFSLLRALPLLLTLGPAQNLCQPQQALISLESRRYYGLVAECNAGNDPKTPTTFSGQEILDITRKFHLNYSLRDKEVSKRG